MGFLGGVGKVASGLVKGVTGQGGADAANKGAQVQTRYLQKGVDALNSAYKDQQALLNPHLQMGNNALNSYGRLLGIGTGDGLPDYSGFINSPGRQFMLDEGENALSRMQSARGSYFSGGAGRELMRFNSGLADQTFNQYADRLGSLGSLGPQTANLLSGYRGDQARGIAGLYGNIGDARASGYVGAANSYAGAANNLLKMGMSAFTGGLL